jgi:hypothetical protein
MARKSRAAVRVLVAAEELPDELASLPQPDTARGAIALGLKLTGARQWERAQEYFELALELPGTGIKRFRDKPAALSDGEKCSALYNIACCQSQLAQPENIQNGLIALAGCLEGGERRGRKGRGGRLHGAWREDSRRNACPHAPPASPLSFYQDGPPHPAGYDDYRQLRTDPDLANIRSSDKFEGLMKRFERKAGGFLGMF